MPTWLEVQQSRVVFFLTLCDSINDMKLFQKCFHHTSAVPLPSLLLIAANLAQDGFLGRKYSLWPVPAWLAVQRSKVVFFLTCYVIINDMKHFRTVSITPQLCHSHFCCWWVQIWPKLDVCSENVAFGLCRLGWRCNGAELYFSWPYIIVSMIWSTSEMFP